MTRKTEKLQPIGICDQCLGDIPPDLGNWTSKGLPRLHCSLVCRQTANSRAGNEERTAKLHERVLLGEWVNPATINPPDPANVGAGVRRVRLAEVSEGRWQNPGLTPEARAINSQPHKHDGPLASAIEKLGQGLKVPELTPEEQEAHRAWRREMRAARREESNAWYRDRYRKQQAALTPEQREAQRQKWRAANRRKAQKGSATLDAP